MIKKYARKENRDRLMEYYLTSVRFINVKLIREGQYSAFETPALLADVPLENWPKMVKRILEAKRIRKQS